MEEIKRVNINGMIYGIVYVDQLEDDKVGEIDYTENIIRIEKHSNQFMKVTLLHEIIHGIFFHLGFTEQDEQVISALAHAIYNFVRDNPELIKSLQKG